MKFSENKYRTPEINPFIQDITLTNKDLKEIKKGQLYKNIELSRKVIPGGFEPPTLRAEI